MYSLKKQFRRLFLNEHRVIPQRNIIKVYIDKKIKDAENAGIEIDESYFEEDTTEIKQFKSRWHNYYSKYSTVILNAIEKGEKSLGEILLIIDNFHDFYKKSGYAFQTRIASGDVTINDLERQSVTSSKSSDKRRKDRTSIDLVEGLESKDFKVIYNGGDWLVIEPKTTDGSIAWAYGLPNGEEEKDEHARVDWCTAAYGKSLENNRFDMYAGNLHMFYFIKKPYPVNVEEYSYMNSSFLQKNSNLFIDDEKVTGKDILNRRLCVSFITSNGEAILATDQNQDQHGAVVNAENKAFTTEQALLAAINNEELYNKVKTIAKGKKETSFIEVYSKITLSMLKREIITLSSPENKENLFKQLVAYSSYAKSVSVINFLFDRYKSYPDIVSGLLNNSNNYNEDIVSFCCDLFTDNSKNSNYFSNFGRREEADVFYSTINHDMFYNIYNTVEKISMFIRDIENARNKQSSFSTNQKISGFINLFFGDYYEAAERHRHIDVKNANKSHYQKFNFRELLEKFSGREYVFSLFRGSSLGNKIKNDKNLHKSYEVSRYLAEDCGINLIETHNCFENKYFIENQLQKYCSNIASGKLIKEKEITNIFLNLNSYNTTLDEFESLGIEESKFIKIVNKSVNKIINDDIDHDSIVIHSKMFVTLCSFFKENQDKSKLYNKTEYVLSLIAKSWLDHQISVYSVEKWVELDEALTSDVYRSFKYLYNIYHSKWPREIWDSNNDEYITVGDDYYLLEAYGFKNTLSKYIKLILS